MVYILQNPATKEAIITPLEVHPDNLATMIVLRDLFDVVYPRSRMWNVVGSITAIRWGANNETDQHKDLWK